MDEDVKQRVREVLHAQEAIFHQWKDADEIARDGMLDNLHYHADRLRDEINHPYTNQKGNG